MAGEWRVEPDRLGIDSSDPESLKGGDAAENLRRMNAILGGEEESAASEAVAINAAAALYVADHSPDLERGLEICREVLRTGAALDRLEKLARRSGELSRNA